jgi:hypothetical protein
MSSNHNLIVPKVLPFTKVRLGRNEDGGYIWPDEIKVDALLSYGVGADMSFERDFRNKFNVPIWVCDHMIGALPVGDNSGITWVREAAAAGALEKHRKRYELAANIAVKMDVEGSEWTTFDPLETWEGIDVLVIELHDLFREPRPLISRIASAFDCFHVHCSNFSPPGEVVETTWIHKRLIRDHNAPADEGPYPGPLDFPCDPSRHDHVCDWWKQH